MSRIDRTDKQRPGKKSQEMIPMRKCDSADSVHQAQVCRQAGFTLIELLVSISVIILLIAILMPALARARGAAQATSCLSNLRQWGIIMTVWQNDHNDYYPAFYYQNQNNAASPHWRSSGTYDLVWGGMLWSTGYYFENANLVYDPGFNSDYHSRFRELPDSTLTSQAQLSWWSYTDYGYNYQHVGSSFRALGSSSPIWRTPARMDEIRDASGTIVLADALDLAHFDSTGNSRGNYRLYDETPPGASTGFIAQARHNGAVNVLWADTHASAVAADKPNDPYTTGLTSRRDDTNYWDRN